MLSQKDFESKMSKGVTWNYCIQILFFPTCIVDFEQVNARWDAIQLKFNALVINPSHFKDSWIFESFMLKIVQKLVPRSQSAVYVTSNSIKIKIIKVETIAKSLCKVLRACYRSLSPFLNLFLLTAVWLPHSQLWAIIVGTDSLIQC